MSYFAELGELLDAEYRVDAEIGEFATEDTDRLLALLRARHRAGPGAGTAVPAGALLRCVGRTARADQLVALLLEQHDLPEDDLRQGLVAPAGPDARRTVGLLDLATDRGAAVLSLREAVSLVGANPAVNRAVTRYLSVMPLDADEELFLGLPGVFTDAHSHLTWMMAAHIRGHDPGVIEKSVRDDPHGVARLLPAAAARGAQGATIMQQFPMWGPLDRPGEGDSGGLAVFLSSLGDAVARQDGVGRVVTLTNVTAGDLIEGGRWLTPRDTGHHVLRLPVVDSAAAPGSPDEPLGEIGWWLRGLLPALDVVPDVAHLRYGSDVTLAVARALRRLGSRIVFGIAPDPHRMILDLHHTGDGGIDRRGMREDLHRMFAADLLSARADSVIAIAAARQPQETARYFPHVVRRLGTVDAFAEGITPWQDRDGDPADGRRLLESLFERDGVSGLDHDRAAGARVLLNVGRWNRLKQQDLLVDAWLRAGLHHTTALVLIGGSLSDPTPVEADMRRQVEHLLRRAGSDVHGRFAWLPRLANRDVRLLERALGEHLPVAAPHVYVCSSIKEEFGISVLEAMEAGLLVVAPRRGGAGSYVRNGVTGFLTDNSTPADLAADLSLVLGGGHLPAWLASIAAEGQRSVRAEYGITTAARRFAGHYLRVGGSR